MATSESEPNVILEPGDPGYVAPEPTPEPTVGAEGVPAQSPQAPDAPQVPPGKDVRIPREPTETDAEYETRTRNVVPISESPTDIVPNKPNIMISPQAVELPQEPVEEKPA